MRLARLSSFVAVVLAVNTISISVAEEALNIQLSSEKGTYRKGDLVVFHLSVENRSKQEVPVLVRLYDWADLKTMEDRYLERRNELLRLAVEKNPPRFVVKDLENITNLAAEYRARGGVQPLGELESVGAEGMAGKYDLCGLDCGTFLKSGRMPAGEMAKSSFHIPAPSVSGTYRFSWRLASPNKARGWEPGMFTSNAVTVQIVD